MEKILKNFEKIITTVLLIVAMVVISIQTMELIWELINSTANKFSSSGISYNPKSSSQIAVIFFNVLLSLEIMETVRIFNQDHETKIKIIFIVCMIAISRKLLESGNHGDFKDSLATAGLILAFSVGYFLIRRVSKKD